MASLLSYALTSLEDVKESLGIPSSNTSMDNLIRRKINQATRQIEKYCDRRFALTAYTDSEYNATHTDQIVLRQRPVVTFTSFEIRDASLNYDTWETIDSHLYFVDNSAGVLNLMFNASGKWSRYKVTYTAGYATIPEDLAEACASLACYYVNNADASDVGVAKKKEGQRELQYANGSLNFKSICQNLGIDDILDLYANMPLMTDR
jgi:hypothetical protein